jgi:hypothetical protein
VRYRRETGERRRKKMTRLKSITRTGSFLKERLRQFMPEKSPAGPVPGRGPLSRREFVRYGTGLTLAFFPLLNCGSAFSGGSGDGSTDPGLPRISFEVRFSESMDTESVEDAVSVSPSSSTLHSGTFTWSEDDTVLNYMTDVDDETAYTVTIGKTAKDRAGNFLDGNSDGTGGDAYSFVVNGVLG